MQVFTSPTISPQNLFVHILTQVAFWFWPTERGRNFLKKSLCSNFWGAWTSGGFVLLEMINLGLSYCLEQLMTGRMKMRIAIHKYHSWTTCILNLCQTLMVYYHRGSISTYCLRVTTTQIQHSPVMCWHVCANRRCLNAPVRSPPQRA